MVSRLGKATAATVAAVACLGGATAEATTGDNVGLPVPKVQLSNHIGWAYEGRFFLTRAPRKAKITAAQLDIADITESEPSFYFGELVLRTDAQGRTPTTVVLDLWWFFFHKRQDRLTARLIPPGSISPQHEEGETIGSISFAVPGGKSGFAHHGTEMRTLKDVVLTVKGLGRSRLTFGRTSADGVVQKIPPAKLYGR